MSVSFALASPFWFSSWIHVSISTVRTGLISVPYNQPNCWRPAWAGVATASTSRQTITRMAPIVSATRRCRDFLPRAGVGVGDADEPPRQRIREPDATRRVDVGAVAALRDRRRPELPQASVRAHREDV